MSETFRDAVTRLQKKNLDLRLGIFFFLIIIIIVWKKLSNIVCGLHGNDEVGQDNIVLLSLSCTLLSVGLPEEGT